MANGGERLFSHVLQETGPPPLEVVRESLSGFSQNELVSGRFETRLTRALKPGSIVSPEQVGFYVRDRYGSVDFIWDSTIGGNRPYTILEGDYGFVMYLNGEEDEPVGMTGGFSLCEAGKIEAFRKRNMDIENLYPGAVLIDQLQARGANARHLLPHFRWEQMLVGMITDWAESEGYPDIFFLPHDFSTNSAIAMNIHRTAYVRYEGTAGQMGFKRHNDRQPFRKILVP